MPFRNRIRIPVEFVKPQFPEERNSFRKANGVVKTISVIIRKTLEGQTDYLPEKWHERLKIALSHDEVNVEGDKYLGSIVQESDYEIAWVEFLDYPTAKAKFKIQVTPFNATNANCQTCQEASQVSLADDTITGIYGGLEEGTLYTWDVSENDSICCYPAVFSLSSWNVDYLTTASISQLGIISVTVGVGLPAANNILLATYRVTCPNGGYDEAKVYANINGTVEACLSPVNLIMTDTGSTTATMEWEAPEPVPENGYRWELFEVETPGSPVQTGTTASLFEAITGLTPETDYLFYLYGVCDTNESNYNSIAFTTDSEAAGQACGKYLVEFGIDEAVPYIDLTYLDCDSLYQTVRIFNQQSRIICAMQNAPGEPVHITSSSGEFSVTMSITYISLCYGG